MHMEIVLLREIATRVLCWLCSFSQPMRAETVAKLLCEDRTQQQGRICISFMTLSLLLLLVLLLFHYTVESSALTHCIQASESSHLKMLCNLLDEEAT